MVTVETSRTITGICHAEILLKNCCWSVDQVIDLKYSDSPSMIMWTFWLLLSTFRTFLSWSTISKVLNCKAAQLGKISVVFEEEILYHFVTWSAQKWAELQLVLSAEMCHHVSISKSRWPAFPITKRLTTCACQSPAVSLTGNSH